MSDSESDSGSYASSSSSSSSSAPAPVLRRPKFIPKSQRDKISNTSTQAPAAAASSATPGPPSPSSRLAATDALIAAQIQKDLAARTTRRRKHWEDARNSDAGSGSGSDDASVDTTDDADPEAEEAAWRLRELKRLKRAREAYEEREKELAELERRRNLGEEERAAEDREIEERMREEQEGRGKMGFRQKYHHRGAFFRDDAEAAGLLQRDIMGARFQDDARNKAALPEYLQQRDATKIGKKGATKYKDLRSEDTGSWGDFGGVKRKGRFDDVDDERFRSDERRDGGGGGGGGHEGRGANAMPLGKRAKN